MSDDNQKPQAEARDFRFPEGGVAVGCTDGLDGILRDFIRKHDIAVEALTEQQIATALRQAIECGDFTRQVRVTDNAQNVIYIPYAREQELELRYKELHDLVSAYMTAPEGSECCKECFDNLQAWWEQRRYAV